jgi:hypothetical protein
MATYIVLNNDKVENLIIAETLEIAEQLTQKSCVLHKDNQPVSIGWMYDGVNFIAPEVTE